MRARRPLLIIALVLLQAACALSPQTVTLVPSISVAAATFGNGHSVDVLATDTRGSALIGSRGGIYAKTSSIESGNDVAAAVREQAAKGLAAQGFTVAGREAQNTLRISIEELAYAVPAGAVATSADISVALKATAERDGNTYSATYRSRMNRRLPVAPTAAQNEAWLNEVLGETLQRLFADEKLRAFLTAD